MNAKIGIQANAQALGDSAKFNDFARQLNGGPIIVMDGLGVAKALKSALPNTFIAHRNYALTNGDSDIYKRYSPDQWLAMRAGETNGDIVLMTTCEPGWNQAVIDWHVALMTLCIPRRIPLLIGGWSTGTPKPEELGMADKLIALASAHPDLFTINLHEYADAAITSGLYGGWPNNAGVQPGTPGGQNLIPFDKWPESVAGVTCFHMGRYKFWLDYCQKRNIPPPRFLIGEWGFDDDSDLEAFNQGLPKTPPYLNIRGYKSLRNLWALLGWYPQWDLETAYFESLKWADKTIYTEPCIIGQCVFIWDQVADQEQFDISNAREFQQLLITHAAQPAVKPISKPIPVVTPEPPVVPPVPQTDPEVDTLPAPTNPDRLKVYDQIADHYQQLSNLFRSLAQMA